MKRIYGERLYERDYDVMELLQKSPDGLTFSELQKVAAKDANLLCIILSKLKSHNFIAQKGSATSGAYFIAEHNEPVKIRKVRCPTCKTPKRVHRLRQHMACCINPNCKNKLGFGKPFCLLGQEELKRGEIRHINVAE